MKKTLVIGASPNESRFSNEAVKLLRKYNHPVIAIGGRSGNIDGVEIVMNKPICDDIDTVALYIGKKHQSEYYDYILNLRPKRLIFNPGTYNCELEDLLTKNGIEAITSCVLVMLKTNKY